MHITGISVIINRLHACSSLSKKKYFLVNSHAHPPMAATTTRLVCCFHRSLLACNRSTRKPVLTVRKICPVKSGCSFYISYCGPRGLSTWHDRERNEGSQFINDGKSETHIPRSIQSSSLGKEYNLKNYWVMLRIIKKVSALLTKKVTVQMMNEKSRLEQNLWPSVGGRGC